MKFVGVGWNESPRVRSLLVTAQLVLQVVSNVVSRRYCIETDKHSLTSIILGLVASPLLFSNTIYGCEILTGRGACHSGGLENFRSKNAWQWQCPNELPILSLPRHGRTQPLARYRPIVRRGGMHRQRSVRSARLFLAWGCVTAMATITRSSAYADKPERRI